MNSKSDITAAASLLVEPATASIATALSDGTARPAGELARSARLAPATISAHLSRLLDAGFLEVEQHGRHRYFRLAGPALICVVESLATIDHARPAQSLRAEKAAASLTSARTCYGHLAGRLGVRLADVLLGQKLLVAQPAGFDVSSDGTAWLEDLGVSVCDLRPKRRVLARPCLDWSERRHHVAGAVGVALTNRFFELSWIERVDGSRAVRVTPAGLTGLAQHLGGAPDEDGVLASRSRPLGVRGLSVDAHEQRVGFADRDPAGDSAGRAASQASRALTVAAPRGTSRGLPPLATFTALVTYPWVDFQQVPGSREEAS